VLGAWLLELQKEEVSRRNASGMGRGRLSGKTRLVLGAFPQPLPCALVHQRLHEAAALILAVERPDGGIHVAGRGASRRGNLRQDLLRHKLAQLLPHFPQLGGREISDLLHDVFSRRTHGRSITRWFRIAKPKSALL